MKGDKLRQTEKNYLYRSIRPKLIAASMLADAGILKQINKDKKEEEFFIDYNLAAYGYRLILPTGSKKRRAKKMPIEDLIVRILAKHAKARYIEAIPIIMLKNKLDKLRLLELSVKYGVKNKIGYLLETAMLLMSAPHLKDILYYLEKNKDIYLSSLADGDRDFLIQTSPKRVRKWNLLGRFFDEDFRRNAEAYL